MENKKNNISRRDFLKRLGMGTASALTLSAAGPLHSFAREKKIYQDATNNMTYRLSRNTGAKVSLLGFGMMRLPMTPDRKIDQEKVNEMVDYAMEHGVNYYDTSPHYGMHQSERATGIALKKYPRESFNLCTKMSSYLDQDGKSREVAEAGYRKSFEDEGYEARLLSRSVEDSATVTSPLVPWSSCGMTQATILSVSTLAYAPFCFFNIISPLMSFLVAAIGWKIVRRRGK